MSRSDEPVASALIHVVDDPTVADRRGSYRVDDEGTSARRTVLVENGVLRNVLTDRATFMIVSGGVNIYPQEIEDALVMHSKVLDVAVVGVPNEEMGEEVKAVVQLAEGIEPTPELEQELLAYAREHLAHYKCPRSIDFEAERPRLPTGKLYKRLLKDRYWGKRDSRIV